MESKMNEQQRKAIEDDHWAKREAGYALEAARLKATAGLTLEELNTVTPELIRTALRRDLVKEVV